VDTPIQRAERFGFLSAKANLARDENPYLRLLLESRHRDPKGRENMQLLAGAWWRGWDLAAGSTPLGLHARKSALGAFRLHAFNSGQFFK
jgi:hypothetical protein